MLSWEKRPVTGVLRADVNGRPDSLGMQEATLDLPDQIERSVTEARQLNGLPNGSDIDQVVVFGMGGSGIAGDIIEAIASPQMTIPVVVSKGYECPHFVGPRTLVMVASFSGETEETLQAVSMAHDQGAQIYAVTCGGTLARLTEEWSAVLHQVDSTIPMPRCAVGAMSIPLLIALDLIGLITGVDEQIDEAVATLRRRCASIREGADISKTVATEIGSGIPLIYGGGKLGQVAAARFKNQINENAKSPAFFNSLPEMCHNEMAGWGTVATPKELNIVPIHLRHSYEHQRLGTRFDFNETLLSTGGVRVTAVQAQGETPLSQLFDLILMGDQTSLEIAALHGQDPGPIDVLAELKRQLGQ